MHLKTLCNLFVLAVSLLSVSLAADAQPDRQNTPYRAVPDAKLQIRAIEYDGSVNGTLKVQVKNTDKIAHAFTATGLYFVPEGNPDTAPQRLGAVGPIHVNGTDQTQVDIAPDQTVEVALDVFCIDSHRGAPTSANKFDVGGRRMPVELSHEIERRADDAVTAAKTSNPAAPPAAARPMAKQAIQSGVWDTRNKNWKPLDGDGKQEKDRNTTGAPAPTPQPQMPAERKAHVDVER